MTTNKLNHISERVRKRLLDILSILEASQCIDISELEQKLPVSLVTIRRDLALLDELGLIVKGHGKVYSTTASEEAKGVISGMTQSDEVVKTLFQASPKHGKVFDQTQDHNQVVQSNIARLGSTLISDHSFILIDSGSTTREMIPFLGQFKDLTVMTNSLKTGFTISQLPDSKRPKLIMTGGHYDSGSDTFQGIIVEKALKSYEFQTLFIGADGIDFRYGTTTINESTTGFSSSMANISQEVVVLIESRKIGRKLPKRELPWKKIDYIVTDSGLKEADRVRLEKKGVKVLIAPVAEN